jgi:hypothetical protein
MHHTGVTLMLEGGINPLVIQKLAGWTSLRMLARYGHVRDAEVTHALQTVEAVIDAPKANGRENGWTEDEHKQGEQQLAAGRYGYPRNPVDACQEASARLVVGRREARARSEQ